MSAADRFREGDRFRVTLEGRVRFASDSSHGADVTFDRPIGAAGVHIGGFSLADAEKITRPLSVGDIVEGEGAYGDIPAGTLLAGRGLSNAIILSVGESAFVNTAGEWISFGDLWDRRVVQYVPSDA